MPRNSSLRPYLAVLLVALLAGCAAGPRPSGATSPAAQAAVRAQSEGDWEAAARWWEKAAVEPGGAQAPNYRLNAADAWKLAGAPDRARALLATLDPTRLSASGASRHALLQAELALDEGNDLKAEFYLDAAARNLDVSLRPRYAQALRRLREQQEDPWGHAIAAAAAAIREMTDYQPADAAAILGLLEDVPSSRLAELALQRSALGPWAELALSVRQTLVAGTDLLSAATRWEAGHQGHWAGAAMYMELSWFYGQRFRHPSRIAVLLPETGNLAPAGAAIRDGLVSAYFNRPGQFELHFMPSGSDEATALMNYSRAAELGYQWVIGPLSRESATLIATLESPPVPALLLNDPEPGEGGFGSEGEGIFSLSLSQQAEARAVARKMLAGGHRRAILLIADNPWGDRVEAAFSAEFMTGGGELAALGRFGADTAVHAETLATLLMIEASRQRKADLQAAIGLPLEFEPARRDDFDALFLATDPVLGRQLKPQLRFFDAGDKPMFAMSRVFSGHLDAAADQDLNGVVFATTRWAVDEAVRAAAEPLDSVRDGAFGALYALGVDALNVLPWLALLKKDPDLAFRGATGQLRLAAGGHLEREPVWARFEHGRPVPEPADAAR